MWFIVFSPYGTDFGILDGDNFHREEQVGNNLRGNYERFLKVNLSFNDWFFDDWNVGRWVKLTSFLRYISGENKNRARLLMKSSSV